MSNSHNQQSVLNAVEGFTELASIMEEMEKQGDDFSTKKGATGNTIAKLHPKRLRLKVESIRVDTPTTKTLRMVSADPSISQLPPFQAGQYVNVFVTIDGVETARPYAISSSPTQRDYYDLTVKRLDTGFVSPYLVDEVVVGQAISTTGPMGTFYHNPIHHGQELVFLAGGSGIAPAMSMLKAVLDKDLPYLFHFIYASSYTTDVIFEKELAELAEAHDNFNLHKTITRPDESYSGISGRVSRDLLEQALGHVEKQMFYICGPTPFNEHCTAELKALGVADKRIRIEANGPPQDPTQLADWPATIDATEMVTITVKGKGSFQAVKGEPLLNSLERNHRFVENACRSGECSLCRVKLLSGEVYNPPQAHLRKSDQQFSWIHSCVAYPLSDIEILI